MNLRAWSLGAALFALSAACSAETATTSTDTLGSTAAVADSLPSASTLLVTSEGSPAAGLAATFSFDGTDGARSAVATLVRGVRSAKLTCATSVSLHEDGTGAFQARCVDDSQPDYAPGTSECTVSFEVALPGYVAKPAAVECKDPNAVSAPQKELLALVLGATPYATSSEELLAGRRYEVASASSIPMTLVQLGAHLGQDPFAVLDAVGAAARPLLGLTPTLSYGQSITPPADRGISELTVFLQIDSWKAPLNALAGRAFSAAHAIDLLSEDGSTLASEGELTARFKAGIGAR